MSKTHQQGLLLIPEITGWEEFVDEVELVLADPQYWNRWVDGLTSIQMDPSTPMRPGVQHVCIVDGQALHQTVDQLDRTQDEFIMVARVTPPQPVLDKLFISRDGFMACRIWNTTVPSPFNLAIIMCVCVSRSGVVDHAGQSYPGAE